MNKFYSGLLLWAMAASAAAPVLAAPTGNVRTASVTVPNVRVASTSRAEPGSASDISMETATRMVEGYFNGLTTMQADFTQSVTGEKTSSTGTFYLRKPRQFLWQYETPERQKIISTGSAVYYVNGDSGQVTQLPTNAGMARLFNRPYLKLAEQGLRVTGVQSSPSVLAVTLEVDKRSFVEDQAGVRSLRLVFERLPGGNLRIHEVDVLDALNTTTRVTFSNIQTGVRFDRDMFDFTPGVYKEN